MSYSNFNTFKLFQNVGINSSSDYMLSMRPNDNNVSFHSSNSIDYNNVDIMSIKNIINKAPNEDLNLSSLNGNVINPVITINNNNQDCSIMTNLNVSGNINVLNGGMINVGDHIQLVTDPPGSSGTYIRDPGATVTGQEHRLYWDTASVLTMVNCGSSVGEVKLAVGGAEKIIANSTGCRIAGVFTAGNGEFRIERIASLTYLYNPGGSHTANNNGEATAAGSYISYHDNGSALYFNLPNGLTGAGNYISFASGSSQKMRIEMGGDLYVCGTVYDGDCPSDSRLKHNQKVYDKNATDILNKIVIKDFMKSQIINFDDKDPDDTSKGMKPFYERLCPMEDCKYDIGVIAQELYEIPELSFMVDTEDWGEEKPATIPNWNPLISLLIKSNQEQETKIIKLETELDTVKTELDTYKLLMDKLTSATSFNAFKDSLI